MSEQKPEGLVQMVTPIHTINEQIAKQKKGPARSPCLQSQALAPRIRSVARARPHEPAPWRHLLEGSPHR